MSLKLSLRLSLTCSQANNCGIFKPLCVFNSLRMDNNGDLPPPPTTTTTNSTPTSGPDTDIKESGVEFVSMQDGVPEQEVYKNLSEVLKETLDDIIQVEEQRAEMAEALLGGCLHFVCTYPEGYKFRQPLYSCKTCSNQTGQLAGICYACSENCHEGHELVELYTKRLFCCDCGNTKFANKCKLYEEKNVENKQNVYNDNFKGIFCKCKKPYPPEEGDEEASYEEMVQCCTCEDWYHPSHIFTDNKLQKKDDGLKIADDIEGLICKHCVEKMPFLMLYPSHQRIEQQQPNEKNSGVDECCKLDILKRDLEENGQSSKIESIWVWAGWRDQLCKCKKCLCLYEDSNCLYLIDPEDTISFYEQRGKELASQMRDQSKPKEFYQMLGEEVRNRNIALKLTTEIELMQKHCVEFLGKRATEKRVITTEDVNECFEELRLKRQKTEEEGNSYEGQDAAWTQ